MSTKTLYAINNRQPNLTSDGYLSMIPQQGNDVKYKTITVDNTKPKTVAFQNILGFNQINSLIPGGTYTLNVCSALNETTAQGHTYKIGFSLGHVYANSGDPNSSKFLSGNLSVTSSNKVRLIGYKLTPHDPLLVGKHLTVGSNIFTINDNDVYIDNVDDLTGTWSSTPIPNSGSYTSDINSRSVVPYAESAEMQNNDLQWVTVNYTVPNDITPFGNADWLSLTIWVSTTNSSDVNVYYGDVYPISLTIPSN